jgi:hypothetical protein
MPKIFISHSNQDNVLTRQLATDLKAMGATVWVDFEQIASGNFAKSINEGLANSEYVILVKSPNSLASDWVREEVDAALNLRIKGRITNVITLTAEDCSDSDVPAIWDSLMDFDATEDYVRAVKGIGATLGLMSGSAQSSPIHPPIRKAAPKTNVAPQKPGRVVADAVVGGMIAFGNVFNIFTTFVMLASKPMVGVELQFWKMWGVGSGICLIAGCCLTTSKKWAMFFTLVCSVLAAFLFVWVTQQREFVAMIPVAYFGIGLQFVIVSYCTARLLGFFGKKEPAKTLPKNSKPIR